MNVTQRIPLQLPLTALLGATAMALVLSGSALAQTADDCRLINGKVPPLCDVPNRGTLVSTPAAPNTEFGQKSIAAEGFAISVDGAPMTGDKQTADMVRRTDLALEKADIQVAFDGLSVHPRLDLSVIGDAHAFKPGDAITLQSETNYPAYLTRGEVRIIDLAALGGPRTVAVSPVAPNGQVKLTLPAGKDLVVVHRVYDAQGRYDETAPLSLMHRDTRGNVDGVEDGTDQTARHGIPVAGGSVTVHGKSLGAGAVVRTLGEVVRPAPDGDFVIQRILPVGKHVVEVAVAGGGQNLSFVREVNIPRSEWFSFATADVTLGWHDTPAGRDSYQKGRLAFYAKGKTASGLNVTASADTGEGDLKNLFRDLGQRDPRTLIQRIDPADYYPVYGDDSTVEEDAPTSGKFYLKVEKDGNQLLWGNFKNAVDGTEYLRSDRSLYGLQGKWASAAQTTQGEPRLAFTGYAANPDNLPQRDAFLGTGGSVFFLQRQDLSIGSETVTVEVRDAVTGRVISQRRLVYGQDYDINYFQGLVTLTHPLSGSTGGGVVSGNTNPVNLVVQYEWTPSAFSVAGVSYGARAEGWVTDSLRIGVTGQVDTTAAADQKAGGVDLRWQKSEDTYVVLEAARSDGPGFGSSYSTNGGLNITNGAVTAGSGTALKFEGRVGLADLGLAAKGYLGAYAEKRDGGFSSIDYQVAADEQLWGLYGEVLPSDAVRLAFHYDDYDSASGKRERKGGAEAELRVSPRLKYTLGLEQTDRAGMTNNGQRTDVALRATVTESDALEWYVFGQGTIAHSTLPRNDRVGVGGKAALGQGWTAEGELSDGSLGIGGKALISKDADNGQSLYFGYELDPNRELDGLPSTGKDRGKYVLGGKRKLSDTVTAWGENTYDLFGQRKSLTSAYGVDYAPDKYLTYSVGVDIGDVTDPVAGNYDRSGLSFGVRYADDERLAASGRVELRRDREQSGATSRDADTIVVKGTVRYKISEAERLSFNLEGVSTNSTTGAVPAGDLIDASIGYAYRPIADDRLNVLYKYRLLYDMFGQDVDGTAAAGPRQKSQIVSVDAEYDLNRYWTVGGKIGFRLSDTSPSPTAPFAKNDAWLAVANARYHIVHNWDALIEMRVLGAVQAQTTDFGLLGAVYRQFGNNIELGVGYNFGRFSDDLTDLVQDDKGLFLNLIAKF